MKVVGLDLSLTGTGIAVAANGDVGCRRFASDPDDGTIAGRSLRLRRMVSYLWTLCRDADLIVVERPSYGSTGGKAHDRSGLWWLAVARFTGAGIPVAEVSPATVKVYATGAGRGDKETVLVAVVRRWPHVQLSNNDEADALMLCSMGCRHLGTPLEQLPQTHTRAMQAVAWPPTGRNPA